MPRAHPFPALRLLAAAALLGYGPAVAADYYLSPSGDDAKTGLSPKSAWRTLDKANATSFKPGDQLLLEGGQRFTGALQLGEDDAGKPGSPVTITSFGTGRATVASPAGMALKVSVCGHLRISKLILAGPGRAAPDGTAGMGLVWLHDAEIDQVEVSGFQKSGILLNKCENVRIANAYAHDNGFAGIYSEGGCDNLTITRCRAINNPGDPTVKDSHSGSGIYISFTRNSLVDLCEAAENGLDMPCAAAGPVGIWAAMSDHITIQHCISHHNRNRPGSWGGSGFDLDGGTSESTLQYNYAYENQGAGFLVCAFEKASSSNNTVRYNLSENDGQKAHAAGIGIFGSTWQSNMRIHNNTVFNSDGRKAITADGQVPETFLIANNLLLLRGGGSFIAGLGKAVVQGNAYWNYDHPGEWDGSKSLTDWRGVTGKEMLDGAAVGLNLDPLLATPGGGDKPTDPAKLASLAAYAPKSASPCLHAAIDLKQAFGLDPGPTDFRGAKLRAGKSAIGAYEAR